MRVLLLVAALVGCSNVAAEAAVDAGDDVEDTAEPPRMESSTDLPDYGPDDALADAVRLDAGSCAARTNACGDSSLDPLDAVVWECANKKWSCGNFYFGIDAEGCATAFAFERTAPEFEACVLAELAAKRFPCIAAGTARRYSSCTVK